MSIKKKIQQSMTVILTVTLVLAYVILSVILYNRNMNLLQTEVKQEAAYIREAINLSDSDYMKQMDNVVESTRVTQIKADGTVLYDSRRDADILKNHGNRKEVREALSKGEGADVRKSETVGKDMYYYALLLNDGTVLRVSKSIDNLASTAVSLMPVMGILAVLTILFAFALARWQTNRLIKPINELDLERPLDSDIYEERVFRKCITLTENAAYVDFRLCGNHEKRIGPSGRYFRFFGTHLQRGAQTDHPDRRYY